MDTNSIVGALEQALPGILSAVVLGAGGTVLAYLAALVDRESRERRALRRELDLLALLGRACRETESDPVLAAALARLRQRHALLLDGLTGEAPAADLPQPRPRSYLEIFIAFLPSLLLGLLILLVVAPEMDTDDDISAMYLIGATTLTLGLVGAIGIEALVGRLTSRQAWQFVLSFVLALVWTLTVLALGVTVALMAFA